MAIDVTVTERAARKIGEILGREPSGTMLRVSVQGGGCSGFQYKFDTERAKADDDVVIERAGATVLIDPVSLDYMAGSEIDFVDDLSDRPSRSTTRKLRRPAAAAPASPSSSVSIRSTAGAHRYLERQFNQAAA